MSAPLAKSGVEPANGFFGWQPTGGRKKQPYHIRMKTSKPFGFAGLWEYWERDGQVIESCTIITADANDTVKPVHNGMPVILVPADHDRWLDPDNQKTEGLGELLRPFPAEAIQAVPVGLHVNNPRNDDPECVEPLAPAAMQVLRIRVCRPRAPGHDVLSPHQPRCLGPKSPAPVSR